MQLLGHEDPNVRYEALVAVQKLMVHNWYGYFCEFAPDTCTTSADEFLLFLSRREYLGKQLEKEHEGAVTGGNSGTTIQGKA